MKQPRISAMERPGEIKFSLETLIRMAAAHKVALQVKFVPFSEMLDWENNYRQDNFTVTRLDEDEEFLDPVTAHAEEGELIAQLSALADNTDAASAVEQDADQTKAENARKPMETAQMATGAACGGM